jgi:hypothetical protein
VATRLRQEVRCRPKKCNYHETPPKIKRPIARESKEAKEIPGNQETWLALSLLVAEHPSDRLKPSDIKFLRLIEMLDILNCLIPALAN